MRVRSKYERVEEFLRSYRSSHPEVKKMFLKISQNSQENKCARVSFLLELQAQACSFIWGARPAALFWGRHWHSRLRVGECISQIT